MESWGVTPANAGGLTGGALVAWATSGSGSITAADVSLLAKSAHHIGDSLDCSGMASLEGLQYLGGDGMPYVLSGVNLTNGTVTDISPLEHLYGVSGSVLSINLSGNQISDLSPLQTLYANIGAAPGTHPVTMQIRYLNLSGNLITDLSPLMNLKLVDYAYDTTLDLSSNPITNTSLVGFAGSTMVQSLNTLNLSHAAITGLDWMSFAYLAPLTTLDLSHNQIVDGPPLTYATLPSKLDLSYNSLASLGWMSHTDMVSLTALNLSHNAITDGSGLASVGFPNLQSLDLSYNPIDLAALAGASMPSLGEMNVSNSWLTSLNGLAGVDMPSLFSLNLSSNNIVNVSEFANGMDLDSLSELYLDNNQISDVSDWLGVSMPSLEYLNLDNNLISDISGWARMDMPSLNQLCMSNQTGGPVAGLSGLAGLTELGYLYLSNDGIADASGLATASGLSELDLSHNSISDASALAGLAASSSLGWVDVSFNQLTDVSALSALAALPELWWLDLSNNQISSLAGVSDILGWMPIAWGAMTDDSWMSEWPDYCYDNPCPAVSLDGNRIMDLSSLTAFGFTENVSMGVTLRDQTASVTVAPGDTISPVVPSASSGPISWTVQSGSGATVNSDGSITFTQLGTVVLWWHDASMYAPFDGSPYTSLPVVPDFSGKLTVTVTDIVITASMVVDPLSGAKTNGRARLADGMDSHNLVITVAQNGGPFLGASSQVTVDVAPEVKLSGVIDHHDGTYTMTATSTTTGSFQATLLLDGQPIGDPCWLYFIKAVGSKQSVQIGQTITADGLGFMPGESVDIYVNSAPVFLGSVVVNAAGDPVHGSYAIPADFPLGTHTFEFVGEWSGTALVSFDVTGVPSKGQPGAGVETGVGAKTGGSLVNGLPTNGMWLFITAGLVLAVVRVRREFNH